MHQIWRIVSGPHREHDASEPVQRSFTLEYETLSITLFNFISAILSTNQSEAAISFFDKIKDALKVKVSN